MIRTRRAAALAVAAIAAATAVTSLSAAADWQRVFDSTGRYSIMVPAPLTANPPEKDANGVVTTASVAKHEGSAYIIVYADGAADAAREMNDARDSFLSGTQSVLTSEHRFKSTQPVGDLPAMEFSGMSTERATECRVRLFWNNGRLYMIGVVSPASNRPTIDASKFLDSFTVMS